MEDFQLEDLKAGDTRKALIPLSNSTLLLTVLRNAKKNFPSFMELDSSRTTTKYVVHLIEAGVLVFLLLTSIISNGLVFLLFYRKPSLRNFSSRFILNLSVSHLLQSLLVIPFVVLSLISDSWLLGTVWCQFTGLVISFLSLNTVLSLLLIALDRNCAVNSPLHYTMTITKKKTEVLIAGTWLVSLLATIPPLLGFSKINYRPQWHTCTVSWDLQDPCSVAYGTMLFLLGFLVPLIKMTWIYCSMFYAARSNSCRARKHSLNNNTNEGPPHSNEDGTKSCTNQTIPPQASSTVRKRPYYRRWSSCSSQTSFFGEEWKAVTTGFLVVFTFIVCWLPYYTVTLVEVFTNLIPILPDHTFYIVILLSLSSCVINPYLYVFRNKSSRKHVKNFFRMKNGLTWFSYLSCQRDRGHISSAASQSASQREHTSAIPVLFRDKDGHWQIISTSAMRSRDDAVETVSNISDECFEPDISEVTTCNQPKECQEESRSDADILSRVYAAHGKNIEFYSFRSVNKMLIFQLKSRKYRNYSSSSDTTDNTSFESTIGNDEYLNWSSAAESISNSRGSTTALLIRDSSDSSARPVLKRFSSFVMEENEFMPTPAISHLGFSRRHSFILTHHRNTDSGETTLTSSTNSESQDFVNSPPVSDVRPQLLRQSNCVLHVEDKGEAVKHECDKSYHS